MFKLSDLLANTKVLVEHKNKSIEFSIESIINRRLKDGLDKEGTFYILNRYLDYKGKEFKDELFKREEEAKEGMLSVFTTRSLDPLPVEYVHHILDMFDLQDVYNFIKQTGIVRAPEMLKDEFNDEIIVNDEGSREQTYLKEDYYQLVSLITVLKSTLGVVGEFAAVKESQIPQLYKEFILLNFYVGHPIFKSPPFQKLLDYITKLTDISFLNEEESSIRIIEKIVSKDDMPYYVLGSALFQRLLVSNERADINEKNLVTKLYNFVKNKIKLKDITSSSNVRIKKQAFGGSSEEDNESTMETYRVPTDITEGFAVEFKFVYENLDYLIRDMGIKNPDNVYKIRQAIEPLASELIPVETIKLIAIILKRIIDPRSVDYIPIDLLLNGLAVAIEWCLERGHKELALIMGSYKVKDDLHQLSISLRNKVSKDLEERLNELYPYHRGIKSKNEIKYVSYIREFIDTVAIELNKYNLITTLPVEEMFEDVTSKHVRINEDIKNQLARLLIDVEEFAQA